ncbi:IclR family transcriptional regulator [Novosphingobium bradum]|uniref:IclR family transcriptional regulator n=1 Tax=Novosphingobium bradum TaxID=1737444 RepID=A0ABV7IPF4_9SPHN
MSSKIVKSAGRTILVLELFAIWRRPATASEIEAALDMPQSSTSVLLRSLIELGYLDQDPVTRRYFPTLRVAMLGDWMRSSVSEKLHAEHIDALRDATGETALVGRRLGSSVHYVQISRSGQELQYFVHEGTRRPLCSSASGRALLSLMPDSQVLRIVRRFNQAAATSAEQMSEQVLLDVIRTIRATGISETNVLLDGERDSHAIAMLMPAREGEERFSLGIAGPRERVLRHRSGQIAALRDWIAKHST